jgi:adenine-specific DNA-methyltransferase
MTAAEADQLADALRNQEPWRKWASKREKRWFDMDPVALHIHERVSP